MDCSFERRQRYLSRKDCSSSNFTLFALRQEILKKICLKVNHAGLLVPPLHFGLRIL